MYKSKTIISLILFSFMSSFCMAYTLDYEELQGVVKEINSSLPLDKTNSVSKIHNFDSNFSFYWESMFLKGYELNRVYRFNIPKPDEIDKRLFHNDVLADLKVSVLLSEVWDCIISTLEDKGGNLKSTFLFSDNTSIIDYVSSEELEDIQQFQYSEDEDILDFVYQTFFYGISYPERLSENEMLTSISYNDKFWIEKRELSWESFCELNNKPKQDEVHDRLLASFKLKDPKFAIIFIYTYLDYKFVFYNSRNKDTFEIVLTKDEIRKEFNIDN